MSTNVRRPTRWVPGGAAGAAPGLIAVLVALLAATFGAEALGAAALVAIVLSVAWGRQADRRRQAAARAFQEARDRSPDPRNRTGPSITIWPDGDRVFAFVEYADGAVDDLAIAADVMTFDAAVELLYRLAARQARIMTTDEPGRIIGDDGRQASAVLRDLTIIPKGNLVQGRPVHFAVESLGRRRAAIDLKAAEFEASIRAQATD